MDNVTREIKILRKTKLNARNEVHCTERKSALMGSSVDQRQLKKESVSLKKCQQKLPKLKYKEKQRKKRTEYPRTMGKF